MRVSKESEGFAMSVLPSVFLLCVADTGQYIPSIPLYGPVNRKEVHCHKKWKQSSEKDVEALPGKEVPLLRYGQAHSERL